MAKSKKRGGRRQRGRRKTNVGSGELRWIGGRAALPGAVSEGGKLLRLDWMMWVEAPSGLIVGHGLVPSAEPAGPVADLLLDAMEKPFAGAPRRPDRVTVASTALAREVREVLGDDFVVEVAPTPELDGPVTSLIEQLAEGAEERSYFEGEDVTPEILEPFFDRAAHFVRNRPWEAIDDESEVLVDVPALSVEGAIALLTGPPDTPPGMLLFPSLQHYLDYALNDDEEDAFAGLFSELDEPCRAVHWLDRDALPGRMQVEISESGWPLAGDLCPVVTRFESPEVEAVPNAYDHRLTAAVVYALAELGREDAARFEEDLEGREPVVREIVDPTGLVVKLTVPLPDPDEGDFIPLAATGPQPVRLSAKAYEAIRDFDLLSRRARRIVELAASASAGEGQDWVLDAPSEDLEYLADFLGGVIAQGAPGALELVEAASALRHAGTEELTLEWFDDGENPDPVPRSSSLLLRAADHLGAGAERRKQRSARRKRGSGKRSIYQIKVTLQGVRPPIWRRLEVSSDIKLARLHDAIQAAMGWTDSHLHEFDASGDRFGVPEGAYDEVEDERKVSLDELLANPKDRLKYLYDFGDGWEHTVTLEKILPLPRGKKQPRPRCTGGRRSCPPEDCGGPWGYRSMLEALADPRHPEHAQFREWLGRGFDPEAFEPDL
jgi:hypothetical protein